MPARYPAQITNLGALHKLLTIFALSLSLAGCASGSLPANNQVQARPALELPTAQPTFAPSPVSTRVMPTDSLTPAPTPTITPIPDEARGMVIHVVDGDTLAVVLDGDPMRLTYGVRLLGIDAPPNAASNPWGVVAYETNAALANLKVVRLVRDETDFDDDGNLLRYVYVGDNLLNAQLVEQGLARVDVSAPNDRLETTLKAAEESARSEELGIWGSEPPTPTPMRKPPPAASQPITTTATITTTPATIIATITLTATQIGTPAATGSPTPTETPASTLTPTATQTVLPTEAATPAADELRGPSN